MVTLEDLLYINDYTLPSLFKRSVESIQKNKDNNEEDFIEPFEEKGPKLDDTTLAERNFWFFIDTFRVGRIFLSQARVFAREQGWLKGPTGSIFGGLGFLISLSSLIIFIYFQYILFKCYCDNFGKYIFAIIMFILFPFLTIPYFYYKRFFGDCNF